MANIQEAATRIADLNDAFGRRGTGGSRYITAGILAKGPAFAARAIAEVAAFDSFDADNDPHFRRRLRLPGHHDFGCVTIEGESVFCKIDLYDRDTKYGSEDPSDPSKTHRVLTIMFGYEY